MPLFSIIVVSLNTKNKFLKTIRSIEKQKYKNYEIIIVDGKSKDGTIDIIKKFKKKKIKFIIEKDKGIYDAMNKGVKISSGKWIIFLNSGDIFNNFNVLKKISQKKIRDYEILFGNTVINNRYFNYTLKGRHFDDETVLMPFCHQSSVVKRKILLNLRFNLKYKISSDFNFFIGSFYKKYSFLDLNLIISNVASGGLSDLNRKKVYQENIKILRQYRDGIKFFITLYSYLVFDIFKNVIKLLIPEFLKLFIFSIKYGKKS